MQCEKKEVINVFKQKREELIAKIGVNRAHIISVAFIYNFIDFEQFYGNDLKIMV